MTDYEFMDLMADLGMHCRRKVVASLLAGNDTQCFTTEQYRDAYTRICNGGDDRIMKELGSHPLELAEMHLRSLRELREVRPGLWAKP